MTRRQHGYRYPRPAALDPLEHNQRVARRRRYNRAARQITAFFVALRLAERAHTPPRGANLPGIWIDEPHSLTTVTYESADG